MSETSEVEAARLADEEADERTSHRLASLLDQILPLARLSFENEEDIPVCIVEAEEMTFTILEKGAPLAGPAHIEIDESELAPDIPAENRDEPTTLEGALFRAAELAERINAHRICALEPPGNTLAAFEQALCQVEKQIEHRRDRPSRNPLARLRAAVRSYFS